MRGGSEARLADTIVDSRAGLPALSFGEPYEVSVVRVEEGDYYVRRAAEQSGHASSRVIGA